MDIVILRLMTSLSCLAISDAVGNNLIRREEKELAIDSNGIVTQMGEDFPFPTNKTSSSIIAADGSQDILKAVDSDSYHNKGYYWETVKDKLLSHNKGDWRSCKQQCDTTSECSAWERCPKVGVGCAGCYLFKNHKVAPQDSGFSGWWAGRKEAPTR
eukprot:gnl/TRDRNA2_/TRDRNA2_181256_c0_seq1.p1 gnl/TRDRNA2_/TRDRNA2_181256_c0~~gnl/TRDRNA2_/TRDRNA2_181256_c0_seq1.p1  ORF type:complete len:157 (-),score=21.83 gnl/TRDRNA2_/TRDRNA2_181256_c0_seq1:74-544(-)